MSKNRYKVEYADNGFIVRHAEVDFVDVVQFENGDEMGHKTSEYWGKEINAIIESEVEDSMDIAKKNGYIVEGYELEIKWRPIMKKR